MKPNTDLELERLDDHLCHKDIFRKVQIDNLLVIIHPRL